MTDARAPGRSADADLSEAKRQVDALATANTTIIGNIDTEFHALENRVAELDAELRNRTLRARILKGVSIAGGLLLAFGLVGSWGNYVGCVVAAAAGVDLLLSNHTRLVLAAKGQNAMRSLLRSAKNAFNNAAEDHELAAVAAPLPALHSLVRTNQSIGRQVRDKRASIEDAIEKGQELAAENLSVEVPRDAAAILKPSAAPASILRSEGGDPKGGAKT